MKPFLIILAALILDHFLGEPRCWHPLVGFGRLADMIEKFVYSKNSSAFMARIRGLCGITILIVPFVVMAMMLERVNGLKEAVDLSLVYLALGAQSLSMHARSVAKSLELGQLDAARQKVSLIVSRDSANMTELDIVKAAIESVLENGSDAIFAVIFWFVIAGAPGVVLYRLANTLDAMWGYKNEKYINFGWAAARLDDVLNFIPARLTALTYALAGNGLAAIGCWRRQASQWYSPNAGPVMSAGAGALALRLGGRATYHGAKKERPRLGCGRVPGTEDIERAVKLIDHGIIIWLILLLSGAIIHA